MSDHVQLAIADLKLRRDQIDVAIAALERLDGGAPASVASTEGYISKQASKQASKGSRRQPPARRAARVPRVNEDLDDAVGSTGVAILKLLKDGPLASGELATRLKRDRPRVSFALKRLAKRGLVHQQGSGPRNFRWHLGAASASRPTPAKEGH